MTKQTLKGWPALLTAPQLSNYLSLPPDALKRVCPVSPLDLGYEIALWSRFSIDAWVQTIPLKIEPPDRGFTRAQKAALARTKARMLASLKKRKRKSPRLPTDEIA